MHSHDTCAHPIYRAGARGVNLAEKVTNFDMVSNDLHIYISKEMNVCRTPAGGCAWGGQKYI